MTRHQDQRIRDKLNQSEAIFLASEFTAGGVLLKLSHYRPRYEVTGQVGKWSAPTLEKLAEELQLCRKTIRRKIDFLKELELVEVVNGKWRGFPRLYFRVDYKRCSDELATRSVGCSQVASQHETVVPQENDRSTQVDGLNSPSHIEQRKEQKIQNEARNTSKLGISCQKTGQFPEIGNCLYENSQNLDLREQSALSPRQAHAARVLTNPEVEFIKARVEEALFSSYPTGKLARLMKSRSLADDLGRRRNWNTGTRSRFQANLEARWEREKSRKAAKLLEITAIVVAESHSSGSGVRFQEVVAETLRSKTMPLKVPTQTVESKKGKDK